MLFLYFVHSLLSHGPHLVNVDFLAQGEVQKERKIYISPAELYKEQIDMGVGGGSTYFPPLIVFLRYKHRHD